MKCFQKELNPRPSGQESSSKTVWPVFFDQSFRYFVAFVSEQPRIGLVGKRLGRWIRRCIVYWLLPRPPAAANAAAAAAWGGATTNEGLGMSMALIGRARDAAFIRKPNRECKCNKPGRINSIRMTLDEMDDLIRKDVTPVIILMGCFQVMWLASTNQKALIPG